MYKHSTQTHRRFMLKKHLLPRFGDKALSEITRQEIQMYVAHLTHDGYAPKSIDHIHDVLSAVLRTAVKWGHLQDNPARGVDLPTLKTVRPKWALTPQQAAALLDKLPPLGRAMVGLAILSGLRRGELFALRWKDIDECARVLTVREAVYDGMFSTPKTEARQRQIPLSAAALGFIGEWKERAGRTEPGALVFATRTGNSISPNNVLRRAIFPACEALALPHATWLTFRRTYSSWSHDKGVPGKVVAQIMGHANVDTTLNVYTQVLDGSLRAAVDRVGGELFTIVHQPEGPAAPIH
jgi:integrase